MTPITPFSVLILLIVITSGRATPDTPPTKENTIQICLRTAVLFKMAAYKRSSVVCLYDQEGDTDKKAAYYEHSEMVDINPRKCIKPVIHFETPGGSRYYFSWLDNKSVENWIDARNFCREMCMELLPLQTILKCIKDQSEDALNAYVRCDVDGCEYSVVPRGEGFLWFDENSKVQMTNIRDTLRADWYFGGASKANKQSDSTDYRTPRETDVCITIVDNKYPGGVHWHEELCQHKKPFICQEDTDMVDEARRRFAVKHQ